MKSTPRPAIVLTTLALCAALATDGAVAADAAEQTAIRKLARTGAISCQPALPHFCANIHVSCSGVSTIRTFPFELRVRAEQGAIESGSDTAGLLDPYTSAHAEWEGEHNYVILRPRQGNGYVKLLADGTFSFRLYLQDATAVMSYGRCF